MSVEKISFYAFFMKKYINWNIMLRDEISGVLYSKNDGQRHPIFSQFGVNSENDDMKQISSDFHRCNSRQR